MAILKECAMVDIGHFLYQIFNKVFKILKNGKSKLPYGAKNSFHGALLSEHDT